MASKKNADGTKTIEIDPSTIDKSAVRTAFEALDQVTNEVEELKAALDAKVEEKSQAVKAILEATGGYSGPFSRNGEVVRLVQRGNSFFVRGKSDKSTFEV